jgi:hypothetical protein
MNGKRLDWDKAKFDSVKGNLVPAGEDINPYEEAKLQAWHDAKKGMKPYREPPTQRDRDTLDLPDEGDRRSIVKSVVSQVKLREQRRKRREQYIARGAKLRSRPTGGKSKKPR